MGEEGHKGAAELDKLDARKAAGDWTDLPSPPPTNLVIACCCLLSEALQAASLTRGGEGLRQWQACLQQSNVEPFVFVWILHTATLGSPSCSVNLGWVKAPPTARTPPTGGRWKIYPTIHPLNFPHLPDYFLPPTWSSPAAACHPRLSELQRRLEIVEGSANSEHASNVSLSAKLSKAESELRTFTSSVATLDSETQSLRQQLEVCVYCLSGMQQLRRQHKGMFNV